MPAATMPSSHLPPGVEDDPYENEEFDEEFTPDEEAEFLKAMELNAKLKAMVEEAEHMDTIEASRALKGGGKAGKSAGKSTRRGGPSGNMSAKQASSASAGGRQPTTTTPPGTSSALPPRENWSHDNYQIEQINKGNKNLLNRLVKIKDRDPRDAIASTSARIVRPKNSSVTINRLREQQRVQQENIKIVQRLERARGCGGGGPSTTPSSGSAPTRETSDTHGPALSAAARRASNSTRNPHAVPGSVVGPKGGIPKGWTRGIGGQLLPPPKMRWGAQKQYDAGAWQS
ncbi:unnamed protein product [Amoebophrya sp. A25]|nr:unnamed protein product [Amoebophrya sp. A25]|eukprot:GSA25T00004719001.1